MNKAAKLTLVELEGLGPSAREQIRAQLRDGWSSGGKRKKKAPAVDTAEPAPAPRKPLTASKASRGAIDPPSPPRAPQRPPDPPPPYRGKGRHPIRNAMLIAAALAAFFVYVNNQTSAPEPLAPAKVKHAISCH